MKEKTESAMEKEIRIRALWHSALQFIQLLAELPMAER